MPSGIDTISVIIRDDELANHGSSVLKSIERICQPDRVSLSPGLALIATVGQGMAHRIGVAAKVCQAVADANINLRVIDQGSSEMNIIIGVDDKDLNAAVKAIYDVFDNE
jgi:aspartate kinase